MMCACLEWPTMSIKTMASIGQLLNRVTGMFKMSFKSFLKKKKQGRKNRSRWSIQYASFNTFLNNHQI